MTSSVKLYPSTVDVAAVRNVRTARQNEAAELQAESIDLRGLLASHPLLRDLRLSGYESDTERRIAVSLHMLRKSGFQSLRPMLPLLLRLKGRPYRLEQHFPFEPIFRTRMPDTVLLKCGRQVSKSTSFAAQGTVVSTCLSHFSTLFLTPLFEQVRRFSQNYVRPFIDTSPVRFLMTGRSTVNSVLERSFRNHSRMTFSFAYLDAERTRGIPADRVVIDEVQDMDMSFLPVIYETMGASPWKLKQFAGTPKTLDNTIQKLWEQSSQAEWVVRCPACGFWNIPSLDHHLLAMIGPWSEDIGPGRPGTICARPRCRRPVDPAGGRWLHRFRDRRWEFDGLHVPQIVLPMHYARPKAWGQLLGKREGRGNTPIHTFLNEVCGESFDHGSRLVTLSDLQRAACLPWTNTVAEARRQLGRYVHRILAVDWGGGGLKIVGKKETTLSFTVMAAMGVTGDGRIDVFWGHRSQNPHERVEEAEMIRRAVAEFRCTYLVHDYTGAGADRETILVMAGFPRERILPMVYEGPAKSGLLLFKPATPQHPRARWQIDKSRSLQLTCQFIKRGFVRFFRDDYAGPEEEGLLRDFLGLVEETAPSRAGKDVYTISRDPNRSDDFAQAVNIGMLALYGVIYKRWPDLARSADIKLTPLEAAQIRDLKTADWEDLP